MIEFDASGFSSEALRALTEASASINSTLDLDEVLDSIAAHAALVIRAEASSVLIVDAAKERLVFAAAFGEHGAELVGRSFEMGLGIAGEVVRTKKPINVADAAQHPDFYSEIDEAMRFETRGLIAAPMVFKGEAIGVVEVINRRDGAAFDEGDVELLGVFANLAAHAARNAQQHDTLVRQNRVLKDSLPRGPVIVGKSTALRETMELADRVAPTHATVLLTGETGTGKEVIANYIHESSPRRSEAFVAVNCAALTETLLESELFGHEKGAFTGATSQHTGRFELADRGTLFLDEIGEMSASTQVKLLRLLQERAFTRVGGTKTIHCDVRVIAATNRDLKKMIDEKTFRDDLYYRLNVFPIRVPPLRERRSDIGKLVEHFAAISSASLGVAAREVSAEARELLSKYDWPGNIRELANVVERAVLLCDGPTLQSHHFPPEVTTKSASAPVASAAPVVGDLRANERAMIVAALRENHWNQSAAARSLGISRDNLRYRIKKYEITRED